MLKKTAEELQSRRIRIGQIRQIETDPARHFLRTGTGVLQLVEPWLQQFALKLEGGVLVLVNCGDAKHDQS